VHTKRLHGRRPQLWLFANTSWYLYNFRARLIADLVSRGGEVTTIAPIDEYTAKLGQLGTRHIPMPIDSASTNPLRESVLLLRLIRLMRRERPDLLLTFTPKPNIYGCLAASTAKVPVIANVSGLGRAFVKAGVLAWLVRRLYRLALRRSVRTFFQNQYDLTDFIKRGIVSTHNTEQLPGSGVDLERFHPSLRKSRSATVFVFLFAARLLRDKGVEEYVQAAERLKRENPNTRFLLVGFLGVNNPAAISKSAIEAWQQDGVIEYLGATDQMTTLYAEADCVVLPSYYREGVPRTLLEAASMAIPVITTNTPGCEDAVENGRTGYLCKPRDVEDLARQMRRMLNLSSEEREELGRAARKKMETEFDERFVINRYLEVVDSVVPLALRPGSSFSAPAPT
jgi:glycosyltransferase involved in cell wall biosynthesis